MINIGDVAMIGTPEKPYEHGLQAPDKFLEYGLNPDRTVTLKAFKGNYYKGFQIDEGKPYKIWETEESYGMCLVSSYREAFADELIRLNKELGVTYFKWDAIGQYECNDPRHFKRGS